MASRDEAIAAASAASEAVVVAPPGEAPTGKQVAAARTLFTPAAEWIASSLVPDCVPFAPGGPRLSSVAWWFRDSGDERLVVVVSPAEGDANVDDVVGRALAWQQDRDLLLVLLDGSYRTVASRLAFVETPVRLWVYDEDLSLRPVPLPTRDTAVSEAGRHARDSKDAHVLGEFEAWLAPVLDRVDLGDPHRQRGYWGWHVEGRVLLRAKRVGRRLDVVAGLDRHDAGGPPALAFSLTSPATEAEARDAADAVRASLDALESLPAKNSEHQMQALIGRDPGVIPGLIEARREYPTWRAEGRGGFIDFLGVDATGTLHVVETKVGGDPSIVLQALDYATWLTAHAASVRAEHPGWPASSGREAVVIDFVLAAKDGGVAAGPYLAGQLEALASDVRWRLFVMTPQAPGREQAPLRQVELDDLWDADPAWRPPVAARRWAGRVQDALLRPQPRGADGARG